MKRALTMLILVPIAIVVLALAVANRHATLLSLDPLNPAAPALSVQAPLFIVVFAAIVFGILLGGIGAWLNQGRWRREARRMRAEAARWRNEALRLREREAERLGLPAPIDRAA